MRLTPFQTRQQRPQTNAKRVRALFHWLIAIAVMGSTVAWGEGRAWHLTASAHDDALGVPGIGGELLFAGPLHPGFRLGAERDWLSRNRWRLFQALELAYQSQAIEHSGALTTQFGASVSLVGPVKADGQVGIGFWYGVPALPTFRVDGSRTTRGSWSVAPSARLNLAVVLPIGPKPEVFAGYEVRLLLPLRPGDLAIPHSSLFVGARFPLPGGAP